MNNSITLHLLQQMWWTRWEQHTLLQLNPRGRRPLFNSLCSGACDM